MLNAFQHLVHYILKVTWGCCNAHRHVHMQVSLSYVTTPQYRIHSSATGIFQNPLQISTAVKQLQLYNASKTYYESDTE